ncbi:1-aminocyclopropane-1-carboxylate deaminase/D-cysteine desulfhydrase [Kangiella aquimarina]|uniref:Pyridoxal-phosphate dependent enzyme n=1 Tax=Kangiella aquimarina TaxID=261965 RepID=A0ABZ0X6K4_9GAMM|nr:pyridoxal-phosphate dependent enzyme [Kangiella aquimarina]WQG86145.1 pyridoxal-phosphate dependent enzyme [Kangiella aquimarina]
MLKINSSHCQKVQMPFLTQSNIELDIKRDDLIHPVVSGNKWRKLKYLLLDAQEKCCKNLVSMGGNWSNHLHALAFAGKELGFKTTAFVRAHENQRLTPTLEDCRSWGMDLIFTSRVDYAQLRQSFQWNYFSEQFPNSYWISEGGFSELAIMGIEEIGRELDRHYDHIFLGTGSGATLVGVAKACPQSKVTGVAAFSGADYLPGQLEPYLKPQSNWHIDTEHHCGGFAKSNSELESLIDEFHQLNQIELDAVYNGKCLLAIKDAVEHGKVKQGDKVLMIHTGGLQGMR